jgi:rSAM/selenodomain-associated transferase 1
VKTRLAADLGAEVAAEVYRLLVEAVLESTVPRPGEYERLLFFTPSAAAAAMRAWLPGARLLPQVDGDLGARMAGAFERAFQRGAARVALVGTDTPGVSRRAVVDALDALDEADVVVGPSEDGGYYLLALRAPHPGLFEGIAWSTAAVLRETRARDEGHGLVVRELLPLHDLDTLDDLRAAWEAVQPILAGRRETLEAVRRAVAPRTGGTG